MFGIVWPEAAAQRNAPHAPVVGSDKLYEGLVVTVLRPGGERAVLDFPRGEPAPGFVALAAPKGEVRVVAGELTFPNGMAITPEAASWSAGRAIWATRRGSVVSS